MIMKNSFGSLLFMVGFISLAHAADGASTQATVCVPFWREELATTQLLVAQEKGFFEKEGLRIQFKVLPSMVAPRSEGRALKVKESIAQADPKTIARSVSECDYVALTIEDVLRGRLMPSQVRPLFFYMYGEGYDTHLVVKKGGGIKSVQDLKGKVVRLGQPPTQIAFAKILKQAGMKPSDVTVVLGDQVESIQVATALEKGEIHAAVTYIPTMPLMLSSGKVEILEKNILSRYVAPAVPHSFIAAVGNQDSKKTARFNSALSQAVEFARANPAELVRALGKNAKFLGVPSLTVSNAEIEKTGDLFGQFKLAQFTGDSAPTIMQALSNYQDLLVQGKFIRSTQDLNVWKLIDQGKQVATTR